MRQERKRRYMPQLTAEQLFANTEKGEDGCWRWLGSIDRDGYGRRGDWLVHRLAFWFVGGEPIEGMAVDHTCFTRPCINPEHLRLLTNEENARRQRSTLRTHCTNGHEFTEENTYHPPATPNRRTCRACKRDRQRERGQAS